MGKKSKFGFWIHLDSNPILNDQVGSGPGPGPHTKFSGATRCKISTGQKMLRKTDFQ